MKYKINYKKVIPLILCMALLVGLAAYGVLSTLSPLGGSPAETDQPFEPPVSANLEGAPIKENKGIYSGDEDGSLKYVYITVLPDDAPGDDYTNFATMDAYNAYMPGTQPMAKVYFQEGSEFGPKNSIGSSKLNANATIETRGKSTSKVSNKSYKISLSSDAGLWQGQKVLNLNKHPFDMTRLRNKLSFDYFEMMPNMVSLRTQFVALYIKDLSSGSTEFKPYGLYTHIEQVNKRFLRMHGLDDNGNLYKATNFEFYRYPEILKLKDEPAYDETKFNQVLEIKGSDDHRELLQMLQDLNDLSIDIDDTIAKHFNKENYLTWLASNIVFGNMDTISQNYYLYRPSYNKTWYFIPWDYDGAWGGRDQTEREASQYAPWESGLTNMWGNNLNKRFLKKEENRKALDKKIEEILKIATPEQTRKMIQSYYPVVSKMVSQEPDLLTLKTDMAGFAAQLERTVTMPEAYYAQYKASIEYPMPIFLWNSEQRAKTSFFEWEPSYDLQKEDIFYDFVISKQPNLSNPVHLVKNLTVTSVEVPLLPKGTYYWSVKIRDSKGHVMIPFDKFEGLDDAIYHGVTEYKVN